MNSSEAECMARGLDRRCTIRSDSVGATLIEAAMKSRPKCALATQNARRFAKQSLAFWESDCLTIFMGPEFRALLASRAVGRSEPMRQIPVLALETRWPRPGHFASAPVAAFSWRRRPCRTG